MSTRILRWLLPAVLIAVPVVAQEPAPDPARLKVAADDFDEGSRLFKLKQFEAAAERFESADRLAPNPAALGNAIRARKAAKQPARAASLAALVAGRYPDDAALRELADSTMKSVAGTLGRVDVACSPACTLVVDGKVANADAVAQTSVFLEPGTHVLVGGWSGERSKTARLDVKKGGTEAVSLQAPALPPPAASASSSASPSPGATPTAAPKSPDGEAPAPATGLPPWVFWGALGATALAGGLTTWSGLDTQANPGPDRVRLECAGQSRDCPAFQEGLSKERRTNALVAVTAGFGVATAVVGLFFTNWSGSSAAKTGALTIGPAPTGRGVSVGLDGVF